MRSRSSVIVGAFLMAWAADRRGVVVAGLLQAVAAASALGVVIATKLALDAILDKASVSTALIGALTLLALSTAASGTSATLQQQQQRLLGEHVSQFAWRRVLTVCSTVNLVTWESPRFADRLERVRSNALGRPTAVVSSLFGLFGSAISALAMVVTLTAVEPLLVPVLLLAGVPAVVFARTASRAEFRFTTSMNPTQRRRIYLKQLMSSRPYAAELRAFDAGPFLLEKHGEEDVTFARALRRQVRLRQRYGLLATAGSAITLTGALLLIVVFVDTGRLTLAEAGAAAIASRLLGSQLTALFTSFGALIEARPFLDDLARFIDEQPPTYRRGVRSPLNERIALRDLRFQYEGQTRPAVDDVTIELPRGAVVALVGENGSGKTTVAKILSGLYEPQSGVVEWDSVPVAVEDLRASVSAVFQHFARYQMTVADNVSIADTSDPPDRAGVERAVVDAGADGFVQNLPSGLDTPLGLELEMGADLSGGQWQRIALARALYREADVVVLDEPTAALDPRAEHELFADMRRMLHGRTALLISHRWSSVRQADLIYVMEEGRVVEQGSHEELMRAAGRYAELYTLQAAAYLDRS